MHISIRETPFDPWQELREYQQTLERGYGATAVFVGTMRDFNEGAAVRSMHLEHYPGMTEKHLGKIAEHAANRWDIRDGLIVHRVGAVNPLDTIVVVAVWAAHRAEALEACRYLIEELKSKAPFWKNERLAQGSRWVERNTRG
ncbi:MAG: molybdenum cofactor biosynthesis protein MoaE [Gammaproteobacteria bacterium]|nr:molybdenum cofactor biosynthesis protein MoaE [Gammaproteobacteria bacterium]NIR97457.1 molybdenum cofactor biosynthesis protein MoaE [Gammaproteobacteria bacterium]NIT63082.1 molybdenum cofactor biosynthesis protein MoaE [Gammaproteobacteria bacterium]NIV20044.1 molybdenum cofactor biosynthesis protein MoaE [Gammaproteobacteria bacterium]NIX10152.1 molybdenum cofactor biosynthesis protein MoaE [Gammaproteobacteria bacterium]